MSHTCRHISEAAQTKRPFKSVWRVRVDPRQLSVQRFWAVAVGCITSHYESGSASGAGHPSMQSGPAVL
jgi:hypothetical protein